VKRFKPIDLVIYAIVGGIVAIILTSISNWVNKDGMKLFETTSSLVFPFLIGVALFIFLVLTIISDFRNAPKEKDDREDKKDLGHDVLMAAVYAIGVLIYAFIVPSLGFIAGTIIFLAIIMIVMNYEEANIGKRAIRAIAVSAVTVPVLHFVFYQVFKVMLP